MGVNVFKLSKTSLRNLDGVHPELVGVVKLAIQITKVDFGVSDGYRTQEQQNKLYRQGRSEPGDIITNIDGYDKKSNHQSGNAVDVFAYVDGKPSWDEHHLSMVACAMLEAAVRCGVNLRWGGLWSSKGKKKYGVEHGWDMPHFERV
jgi:peptidoglycan L-alanyl-D-glutamate endopeptidase CwlK